MVKKMIIEFFGQESQESVNCDNFCNILLRIIRSNNPLSLTVVYMKLPTKIVKQEISRTSSHSSRERKMFHNVLIFARSILLLGWFDLQKVRKEKIIFTLVNSNRSIFSLSCKRSFHLYYG